MRCNQCDRMPAEVTLYTGEQICRACFHAGCYWRPRTITLTAFLALPGRDVCIERAPLLVNPSMTVDQARHGRMEMGWFVRAAHHPAGIEIDLVQGAGLTLDRALEDWTKRAHTLAVQVLAHQRHTEGATPVELLQLSREIDAAWTAPEEGWRTAVEAGLGTGTDPVGHTPEWARRCIHELRELERRRWSAQCRCGGDSVPPPRR